MSRSKQTRKGVLSAKARVSKTKMMSSSNQRDLVEKFARMCLDQSSQSNVSETLLFSKLPSAKPAKGGRNHTTSKGYEQWYAPVVPPSLYRLLQEAVGYIKDMETDEHAERLLRGVEGCIQSVARYHKDSLPKDWKYDRATAGKWQCIPYFIRSNRRC